MRLEVLLEHDRVVLRLPRGDPRNVLKCKPQQHDFSSCNSLNLYHLTSLPMGSDEAVSQPAGRPAIGRSVDGVGSTPSAVLGRNVRSPSTQCGNQQPCQIVLKEAGT